MLNRLQCHFVDLQFVGLVSCVGGGPLTLAAEAIIEEIHSLPIGTEQIIIPICRNRKYSKLGTRFC